MLAERAIAGARYDDACHARRGAREYEIATRMTRLAGVTIAAGVGEVDADGGASGMHGSNSCVRTGQRADAITDGDGGENDKWRRKKQPTDQPPAPHGLWRWLELQG